MKKLNTIITPFDQSLELFTLGISIKDIYCVPFWYDKTVPCPKPIFYKQAKVKSLKLIPAFLISETYKVVNSMVEDVTYTPTHSFLNKWHTEELMNPEFLADVIIDAVKSKQITVNKVNAIICRT